MKPYRRDADRHSLLRMVCTLAVLIAGGPFFSINLQGAELEHFHTHARWVLDTNAIAAAKPVMVNASNRMQTLIGFFGREKQQPPWSDGNRVMIEYRKPAPPDGLETFVQLNVINMYAENFAEITKRLGTETIEMAIIPRTNYLTTIQERDQPERKILHEDAVAVITDARIPREWYFYSPRVGNHGLSAEEVNALLVKFPLSFRPFPKDRAPDEKSAK